MSDAVMTQIRVEVGRLAVDLADGLVMALVAPFYVVGWLVGFAVRCVLWAAAAVVAGYKAGRQ